ncbi:MAG: mechanosensitive ion channel family protein [Acetobacteraceae bacterium]|nr:mechanosensitive ion channel family protein [Acetobacteraceae bacterium]
MRLGLRRGTDRGTGFRPLMGPAALALAGFGLRAAAPALAQWLGLAAEGSFALAARDLGGIGGWLALAWGGARSFDILLLRAAATRRDTPYPRLLGDLVRVVLFAAAAVAIVMLVFGQPAVGLITTSSVAIAVVGFALRNIISDVFSGVALNFDNPYRIGDWIETAEGCAGRVTEISWRATRLVTRDGAAQMVPNGLIAAHRLVNYGGAEGAYRAFLRVPLDPALPPARAKRILLAGALDAGRSIPGLSPSVILQEVADGTAVYLVRFQVPNYEREAPCRDAVASAVLRALQAIGLGVARPARDMHVARRAPAAARPRRQALLRQIGLFRGFTAEERAELEQRMRERFVPRGASIVRQGEAGQSLFVLAEGVLDVTRERGGADVTLDRMVPGDVFGEMSLLTGQARSATVTAETDAVVFEIDKAHLDALLQRRPELAEGLANIMAGREAHNANRGRDPERPGEPGGPPGREDLLGRLRAFFGLG